jgi:hypothetical protein
MKIKIFGKVILLAFVLSLASVAAADGVNKRLRFARGKSSVVASGAVVRGDRDTYTFGARAGQMLRVKIASNEKNAVFQIQDSGGNFLAGAGEGDDAMNWSGELPTGGDYKIIVGGTRGNASYRMTVSIK